MENRNFGRKIICLLPLLLVLCLLVPVRVNAAVSGNYQYTVTSSGNAVITKYLGNELLVNIPSELAGHKVVKIGYRAFYKNGLTYVKIPQSVKTIEPYAFYRCNNLNSVVDNSVNTIGEYAFYYCDTLYRVTIKGNRNKTIGKYAFGYCSALHTVTIKGKISHIGEGAFFATRVETFRFPEGIKTINRNVVAGEWHSSYHYGDLKKVYIPKSVTRIKKGAFAYNRVTDIYYAGSVAQWQKIYKAYSYDREIASDYGRSEYYLKQYEPFLSATIHCSDGTIKNGVIKGSEKKKTKKTLPKPKGLKILQLNKQGQLVFTWDAVPGAMNYVVFYKSLSHDYYVESHEKGYVTDSIPMYNPVCLTEKNKAFLSVKALYGSGESETQKFYVRARDSKGNYGEKSDIVSFHLPRIHYFTVKRIGEGKYRVSWKKEAYASGYQIGIRNPDKGDYKFRTVKTITDPSITSCTVAVPDEKAGDEGSLNIIMRAYVKLGEGYLCGPYSYLSFGTVMIG